MCDCWILHVAHVLVLEHHLDGAGGPYVIVFEHDHIREVHPMSVRTAHQEGIRIDHTPHVDLGSRRINSSRNWRGSRHRVLSLMRANFE